MKQKLDSASFEFSQEGNCIDKDEYETLTIECKSDIGIDNSDGCFYVLRTEQWSIDSVAELEEIFERINKAIKKQA